MDLTLEMAEFYQIKPADAKNNIPFLSWHIAKAPERVCQDKCVSFFTRRKAVRKGRLFYGVAGKDLYLLETPVNEIP